MASDIETGDIPSASAENGAENGAENSARSGAEEGGADMSATSRAMAREISGFLAWFVATGSAASISLLIPRPAAASSPTTGALVAGAAASSAAAAVVLAAATGIMLCGECRSHENRGTGPVSRWFVVFCAAACVLFSAGFVTLFAVDGEAAFSQKNSGEFTAIMVAAAALGTGIFAVAPPRHLER